MQGHGQPHLQNFHPLAGFARTNPPTVFVRGRGGRGLPSVCARRACRDPTQASWVVGLRHDRAYGDEAVPGGAEPSARISAVTASTSDSNAARWACTSAEGGRERSFFSFTASSTSCERSPSALRRKYHHQTLHRTRGSRERQNHNARQIKKHIVNIQDQ